MIYHRLHDLRKDNNVTEYEIADFLHVAQNTYSQYETGKREIPIEVLSKLADYYNISVDYLLGRTDIKTFTGKYFNNAFERFENSKQNTSVSYQERIKLLRTTKDLSQTQVSNFLHIEQSVYSDYENGKTPMPAELLIKLAQFYDVDLYYICGITDIKTCYPDY